MGGKSENKNRKRNQNPTSTRPSLPRFLRHDGPLPVHQLDRHLGFSPFFQADRVSAFLFSRLSVLSFRLTDATTTTSRAASFNSTTAS